MPPQVKIMVVQSGNEKHYSSPLPKVSFRLKKIAHCRKQSGRYSQFKMIKSTCWISKNYHEQSFGNISSTSKCYKY